MDYEGVVTKVDPFFLYIELNKQTRVHMSISVSDNELVRLPEVGSSVSVRNAHKYPSMFVLCKTSKLSCFAMENIKPNDFLDIVKNFRLGAQDLVTIDGILRLLESNFHDLDNEISKKIIVSLLEKLLAEFSVTTLDNHVCLNKHISHLDLVSANSCKHVEIQSDKYNDFPHWSFGVHSKPRKHTLLFGFLFFQKNYGFSMLKDSLYQIVCVITNANPEQLHSIVDSYVLIKNYKVITEIFKEDTVPNVECLLINFEDVAMVYSSAKNQVLHYYFNDGLEMPKYQLSLEFELKQKGMTCIGESKQPECRLNVLITKQNEFRDYVSAFLILPAEYIQTTSYLREGRHYRLNHRSPLKETKCLDLRMYNHKTFEVRDAEAYFECIKASEPAVGLLTVEECKKHIANSYELVSFTGILSQKRFANKLSSRIPKRSSVYGFGTPGSKAHQLVFSCTENDTKIYLDCYLNDWDNTLMPLCIIPQMRISVRNVQPQSKKYLKSTPLTSLEILSYEPQVEFQTANLFGLFEHDWGPPFFLGHGNRIPFGVIVWGRVLGIQVLSIKMANHCKECRYINERAGSCVQCGGDKKQMEFLAKLHVSDEYGQSKVLVKRPDFMKAILDLQTKQFEIWMKAFEEIGQYDFSLFEKENILNTSPETDRDFFKYALTAYLTKFNKCAIVSMEMKCRKLDSNPQRNGGRPLWFCLDIRRC